MRWMLAAAMIGSLLLAGTLAATDTARAHRPNGMSPPPWVFPDRSAAELRPEQSRKTPRPSAQQKVANAPSSGTSPESREFAGAGTKTAVGEVDHLAAVHAREVWILLGTRTHVTEPDAP